MKLSQRIAVNGTDSCLEARHQRCNSGINMGPTLFKISANGLYDCICCILSKFPQDINLGGVADAAESSSTIQRDIRLEKWTDRNLTKLNKRKYKVLWLKRNNSIHQNILGTDQLENNMTEDLQILLCNMNQLHVFVVKKPKDTFGCSERSVARRWSDVIL